MCPGTPDWVVSKTLHVLRFYVFSLSKIQKNVFFCFVAYVFSNYALQCFRKSLTLQLGVSFTVRYGSAREANSTFDPSGVDKWVVIHVKWITEANGRWHGQMCGLPPTWLSAASCKAGVYARCQLKTMETGDERPLLVLWVMRGPTTQWIICLFVSLSSNVGDQYVKRTILSYSRRQVWYGIVGFNVPIDTL